MAVGLLDATIVERGSGRGVGLLLPILRISAGERCELPG